jgi:hypothetical protein
MLMKYIRDKYGDSFIGYLVTIGRVSKKEHRVPLRFVYYNDRIYASRRNMNSDWIKNIMHNPNVRVEIDDVVINGRAKIVSDDPNLCSTISRLKYKDGRGNEPRIIVEIEPLCNEVKN